MVSPVIVAPVQTKRRAWGMPKGCDLGEVVGEYEDIVIYQ